MTTWRGSGLTSIRLILLTLVALPCGIQAQLNPLQNRLAAATRLECRFSAVGRSQWDGGTAGIELADANLEAVFFDIDIDEGTAEVEGRFGGASYIIVRYSTGYLHLIQMFGAGPLYVTSVMAQETTDGRMMAVHNRVEYTSVVLPGFTSRPEAYVGDCAVS
jgi:hypothetical protein